jgi:hypothetical protein
MKAHEVLKRYKAGIRDFRGANLRGQSFIGENLSGADLSKADVRGADFTRAKLQNVNFTGAKAGLQNPGKMVLLACSWLLSVGSGLSSGIVGLPVMLMAEVSFRNDGAGALVSLIALVVFFVVTIRQGLPAGFKAFAVAVTGTFAIAVVGTLQSDMAAEYDSGIIAGIYLLAVIEAAAIAVAVAVAFAIAVPVAVAVAIGGTLAGAVAASIAVAIALFITVPLAIARPILGASAITEAIGITLLCAYIGWRAIAGNKKDAWVRRIAIAFASTGGTSFRQADLTDANFTCATLKCTDLRRANFTRANLTDTRWY